VGREAERVAGERPDLFLPEVFLLVGEGPDLFLPEVFLLVTEAERGVDCVAGRFFATAFFLLVVFFLAAMEVVSRYGWGNRLGELGDRAVEVVVHVSKHPHVYLDGRLCDVMRVGRALRRGATDLQLLVIAPVIDYHHDPPPFPVAAADHSPVPWGLLLYHGNNVSQVGLVHTGLRLQGGYCRSCAGIVKGW